MELEQKATPREIGKQGRYLPCHRLALPEAQAKAILFNVGWWDGLAFADFNGQVLVGVLGAIQKGEFRFATPFPARATERGTIRLVRFIGE